MKAISTILVILDKPKHDQVALDRARRLAAATGARLHLASFCWLPMAEQRDVFDAHQRRTLRQSIVRQRQEWLRALVLDQGLAAADVTIDVIWTDDIAAWVAENAKTLKADLVVKSVHHRETMLHTPLDWSLLRSCPVPVYLAATAADASWLDASAATGSGGRGRAKSRGSLLATIDLRHTDRKHQLMNMRVLDAAAGIAEWSGTNLHVVHAIAKPVDVPGLDRPAQVVREFKARARELLEAMLAPYKLPRTRVHLPEGKVGAAVAETARATEARLVVVGTGARRGIGAALLGDAAERILERSPCDVLAVHA